MIALSTKLRGQKPINKPAKQKHYFAKTEENWQHRMQLNQPPISTQANHTELKTLCPATGGPAAPGPSGPTLLRKNNAIFIRLSFLSRTRSVRGSSTWCLHWVNSKTLRSMVEIFMPQSLRKYWPVDSGYQYLIRTGTSHWTRVPIKVMKLGVSLTAGGRQPGLANDPRLLLAPECTIWAGRCNFTHLFQQMHSKTSKKKCA